MFNVQKGLQRLEICSSVSIVHFEEVNVSWHFFGNFKVTFDHIISNAGLSFIKVSCYAEMIA